MKTIFNRKRGLLALFTVITFSALFISCTKNDNNNNSQTYNTTGNASGAQQNPAVATTGTGTMTGTYNATTNNWQYTINWSTLTSTASAVEIHGPASAGVNAALLLGLTITTPGINGSANGNITLTEQQEAYLLAGQLYYTVLTAAHITGEIRGQISASIQ
ncbi:MAG: CHRD domain-containing protein [Chitinophagaceae bacterium]